MSARVKIEMVDVQGTILREIADSRLKQADIAATYAFGIAGSEPADWPLVNRLIVDRWSLAGLTRIKTLAWKRVGTRDE